MIIIITTRVMLIQERVMPDERGTRGYPFLRARLRSIRAQQERGGPSMIRRGNAAKAPIHSREANMIRNIIIINRVI